MDDRRDYFALAYHRYPYYYENYVFKYEWKGIVDKKLEKAAPYGFFLTTIRDSFETNHEDLTISLPELLDNSLGILEYSVHINFLVDVSWLCSEYSINDLNCSRMTIVSDEVVRADEWHTRNVKIIIIPPSYRFGKMHTKMSIFFYTDKSVRFVIYTANLTPEDWEARTQGVWVSPKCPYMGDDIPINYGESDTLFKLDIIKYLASYDVPELREWIFRIQKCDLSSIKVCLVASIPGEHDDESYGYKRLNKLLRENVSLPTTEKWDYVVQASSIGSMGYSPQLWFTTFTKSLHGNGRGDYVPAKIIYPTQQNVLESYYDGSACLFYTRRIHERQKWVRECLHVWKSDDRHRTKALPHIKTYARLTKDGKQLAWFLLTSANLSKAAWGSERANGKYVILSHELGVLFLPSFFNGGDVFEVRKGGYVEGNNELFPLPYDTPIVPYGDEDRIFFNDQ